MPVTEDVQPTQSEAVTNAESVELGQSGPYRNLLVPLVVVPALIVMVLVAVFALFGAIAGEETTPAENLERMLYGGQNERQQATFNLVVQISEGVQARREGRVAAWNIDPSFLPKLRDAWDQTAAEDPTRRLVLAILLGELGDEAALDRLLELSDLAEEIDPGRQVGLQAIFAMGWLAESRPVGDRERAARLLVARLDDADMGVRLASTAVLPKIDAEIAAPALEGMLSAGSLELRGTAALSLAELGSDAGAAVLRDLLRMDTYATEREVEPDKWADPGRVSASRRQALAALVGLGQPPTADEMSDWSSDADLAFREDVLELLAQAD